MGFLGAVVAGQGQACPSSGLSCPVINHTSSVTHSLGSQAQSSLHSLKTRMTVEIGISWPVNQSF